MNLHIHTEYALQILQHLHKHKGVLHTAASISIATGIRYPTVAKIAKRLKEKGLIKPIQGRWDSYALGRPASEISAYDVLVCMESNLGASAPAHICALQEKMLTYMTSMSIADMVSGSGTSEIGAHDTAEPLKTQAERQYRVETIDKGNYSIPIDKIILIRSSPQQGILELHQANELLEVHGQISRIALNVPEFFRSHTSVIVNINHIIKDIDEKRREIVLTNGLIAPIAKQKIVALRQLIAAQATFVS